MKTFSKNSVRTSDGVRLNLIEAGEGDALLLLPGWSQSAALFRHQLEGLSDRYRVIALDWRGHGDSEKVEAGYRISRLAMDLHDVLMAYDLESVSVLGHSMGNAVVWCHWDLFGRDRLSHLIIAEQPPTLLSRPSWTFEARDRAGCICDAAELQQNCESIEGPGGDEFRADFVSGMLSSQISEDERSFIIEENLRMPPNAAATLLFDTSVADWRDLIPRIDVPTLICAGRGSVVPFASQCWIRDQIPNARLEEFAAEEGGSHFMFWEAPEQFNRAVLDFLP